MKAHSQDMARRDAPNKASKSTILVNETKERDERRSA